MSLKYLKDKNGRPICNTTKESQVFDSEGKSIQTKILELTNTIGSLLNDILETKKTVDDMTGKGSNTNADVPLNHFQEALKKVILREDPSSNICLLKDDKGLVTSDYGYDYKLLSGILYTGRYEEYIKDGDWIELSTADGGTYKLYANIDTYYGEGEDGNKIGHHIDFISKELVYGSTGNVNGANIYGKYGEVVSNEATKKSWRMNYDTTYNINGSSNGVATETSPFLSNSTEHRGSEGGIIDRLNEYYNDYIPGGLKSYIIKKYHKVPTRYQEGTGLTDDNGSKWAELPYLWIPYYKEIWGDTVTNYMPTTTYETHMSQYHSFSNIENFRMKMDKKDTGVCHFWWTASPESGYNHRFCRVGCFNDESKGTDASDAGCYYYDVGAPLCFRFKGREYTNNPLIRDDLDANICLLTDVNGVVSSAYNYDYEFISDGLYQGDFDAYVRDGDWIELTTADGATYKMYANIDTYYGYGPEGDKIGHHIDFISKELIYGSTSTVNGVEIYSESNVNSWRMNGVTSVVAYGNNNGVESEQSPFLANCTKYRGSSGGIIDKLDAYYNDNIPSSIKSYIIKKYHNVPYRYDSSSANTTKDTGSAWREMPYLWIPYEKEIHGVNTKAETTYEDWMKQYYTFENIDNFKLKYDAKNNTTSAMPWWGASSSTTQSWHQCMVNPSGLAGITDVNKWMVGAPLCFRFTARPASKDPIKRDTHAGNICLLKDDNGVVTSDFNYNYEFLADKLCSGKYTDYIKDGDYIELTTADGATYKMYANVDTYYGDGDGSKSIGHHIDFISKELIYGSRGWQMNIDTTYDEGGNNNGVATENSSFLANSKVHRGTEGIVDKLDTYYNNIPNSIKSYIIKKYHKVPTRYQEGVGLITDNGSKWAELPYLWIPYIKEIFGDAEGVTETYESHMVQYNSFISMIDFINKVDHNNDSSTFVRWWSASSYTPTTNYNPLDPGNLRDFIGITPLGTAAQNRYNHGAASVQIGTPLCFRFAGRPASKDPIVRDTHAGNICLLKDDNGTITSDFNYDYEFLADTLNSGNYSDYIKDGDWIELTTSDHQTHRLYANIDTYYGYGDGTKSISHHIDFISRELITSSIGWVYRTADTTSGTSTEKSPFLASSTVHRTDGNIIDKMNEYFENNINSTIKSYIVKKYHSVPYRYDGTDTIVTENGSEWGDMGYLWLPYEKEILGYNPNGSGTYEGWMKQYHSFINIPDFHIKHDMTTGEGRAWWTATAKTGVNEICYMGSSGLNWYGVPTLSPLGIPLCFRFAAPNSDTQPKVREDSTKNVCLMKDLGNGVYQSDYGYTYDFISDTLQSGNYSEYLKDGDWFELNTADGGTYKMYANIDTYYGEGETGKKIGHHIDFIADNVIYGSSSVIDGKKLYESFNKNAWYMNNDKTYYVYGNSSGVANETSPFLANSTTYRSPDGGIIDKLNSYYTNYIPSSLKAHIIKKYHKVPTRYQSGTGLTSDNGSKWAELPYLWLPYEKEANNTNYWSTGTYESHMKYYHSFANIPDFKIKKDTKNSAGTTCAWWLASASTTNATFAVMTNGSGTNCNNACVWYHAVPLCFRFQ